MEKVLIKIMKQTISKLARKNTREMVIKAFRTTAPDNIIISQLWEKKVDI